MNVIIVGIHTLALFKPQCFSLVTKITKELVGACMYIMTSIILPEG